MFVCDMLLLKESGPNANFFLTSIFVYQNSDGDSLLYSSIIIRFRSISYIASIV